MNLTSPTPWKIGVALGVAGTVACLATGHPIYGAILAFLTGPMALIAFMESL